MANAIKQLPYGVSDFERIQLQNYYYVDKSPYLQKLEDTGSFLFFVRPRRFGKSLFVSMMRAYYDKARKNDFQKIFGNLWIGQHPTPQQGRYQVLYLDFSKVGGTVDEIEEKVNAYGRSCIKEFVKTYGGDYDSSTIDSLLEAKDFGNQLNILEGASYRLRIPLYLILDEYDNFTNTVLSVKGHEVYHAMTHAYGFYRDLFKIFKGMFERIFMTGISPVTLNDLTSGYNIGMNISGFQAFDKMLGFSTTEVREVITYYKDKGMLPTSLDVEATLDQMAPWYDNYCFSEDCLSDPDRVFNPNMTLYYMNSLLLRGLPPKVMADPNISTDYAKLWQMLQLDQAKGEREGVLRTIVEEGEIGVLELYSMFSADRIMEPEVFPSLLFYNGMLTLAEDPSPFPLLRIPNNTVRKQYYGYLLRHYNNLCEINLLTLPKKSTDMAVRGEWREALTFIASAYGRLSSVRDAIEGERNIQGFFLAYLNLNPYYLCAPEVEVSHGFCDFFLLPDMTHYPSFHSYILELKYLPKSATPAQQEAQWNEAVEQIHRYAEAPRVQTLRQGTTLHTIILQFTGWELTRMEEVVKME